MIAVGVVGAARKWSDTAMIPSIILGVVVTVAAVVGALPGGNWKEGQLQWPEIDLLARVDELESAAAAIAEQQKQRDKESDAQIAELRARCQGLDDLITDYILAHEPPPDDGMVDEDRLQFFEDEVASAEQEVQVRLFTGEDYDDGIGLDELRENLEELRGQYRREERRQRAWKRFPTARG
ncbi:hypothetical protein KBX37_14520 [Micromonospora sp. U56]|uniref:hypothetical protein n=1 Tax=Micromonospora sp. U56 TaxID=2824900 RepID=UPI001B38FAC9|nr:hypothetical protein [Micromonospora sp. U56]MBQ0894296.1 hypothetical protein [Micromonospora sp. U56]